MKFIKRESSKSAVDIITNIWDSECGRFGIKQFDLGEDESDCFFCYDTEQPDQLFGDTESFEKAVRKCNNYKKAWEDR